jgi:ABC-2 type transport system permease protein
MRWSAIRPLLWKETRQLGRNRSALLTSSLLPFVLLFVAPVQILLSIRLGSGNLGTLRDAPLPGFAGLTDPTQLVVQFVYPLLLVLGGLLLPSLTTTYAIVAERERRSLDLLVSLPVTVSEILTAKLLSVLFVTAMVGLPYVSVVLALLLLVGLAGPATIPALLAPFLAAIVCSTGIALLLTLLARDFRTANNLNGAFFVPILFVSIGTLSAISGPGRTYVLAAMLLVVAAVAFLVALRWISFERYLE